MGKEEDGNGIIGRIKRRKYFRYDLFVNTGGDWKQFGDSLKKFIKYKNLEHPEPGSLLRLYGVYNDSSEKDGWGRDLVWEKLVPMPGGTGKKADGTKKELSIEDRLMNKVVEHADFTKLQPSKLSIPFGKSGSCLELQATPSGGDYGEIPAISFDGNLPAWLHPAAGALIINLMEKGGDFLRKNISGAISDATGIKTKETGNKKDIEQPTDSVDQLDKLLAKDEDEEQESKKNEENVTENNKRD